MRAYCKERERERALVNVRAYIKILTAIKAHRIMFIKHTCMHGI